MEPNKDNHETEKMDKETSQEVSKKDVDKELERLLQSHRTVIKVFGMGGAGNNTIARLVQMELKDVVTFAVNTDAQDLLFSQSHHKVLIGRDITNGLGAGSDPKIGEDSAQENAEEMKELVANTDLVFVTCGLGGGTGTGSSPIVAELARAAGALTISIVTLPFSEEGVLRWNNAKYGLERLKKHSDTLIVIQNDKLWEIAPEIPLDDAFKVADEILVNAVKGITELVTEKGLVNLDFADVRTIMKDGGTALIGMAESDSPDRAVEAVEKAVENPLIDLDIQGAKSALLNITGGKDMTIKDAKAAMQTLAKKLDKSAKIIWGSRINTELDNKVRAMVIATGLRDQATDKLIREGTFKIGRKERLESKDLKASESVVSDSDTEDQKENGSGEEDGASKTPSKEETKKIFREIMEEEADADLKFIEDTLDSLSHNIDETQKWEELKQSCSSLTGTAQMFDYFDIAELTTAVEGLLTQLIDQELYTEEVLQTFNELPDRLKQMITDQSGNHQWQQSYKEKVEKTTDYLKSQRVDSVDQFQEHYRKIWDSSNNNSPKDNENPDALRDQKLVSIEQNQKDQANNGGKQSRFSSVNDVVKYVDNILSDKSKSGDSD